MTVEEFSNEFDTLLNSFNTLDYSINLDEYEKSVFLTKAQEEIIIDFYNGKNPFKDSFEKTEEVRRYLSNLNKTYTTTDKKADYIGLSKSSIFFELPEDLWFITYESVTLEDDKLECMNNREVVVTPITQDDYYRISRNPFRCSNKNRVIRIDVNGNVVEIISEYNISRYLVKYVSKPTPIILTDLTDNLSINGISLKTECELNPVIHRVILEKAVKLALVSRTLNTGK